MRLSPRSLANNKKSPHKAGFLIKQRDLELLRVFAHLLVGGIFLADLGLLGFFGFGSCLSLRASLCHGFRLLGRLVSSSAFSFNFCLSCNFTLWVGLFHSFWHWRTTSVGGSEGTSGKQAGEQYSEQFIHDNILDKLCFICNLHPPIQDEQLLERRS